MMTKKQFAEVILKQYMKDLGIKDRSEAHCAIYGSSGLAVACEYLDLLSPFEKEYSQERDGLLYSYLEYKIDPTSRKRVFKGMRTLSVRDILELLPDELPDVNVRDISELLPDEFSDE